jgi:ribosomal protein L11 methyltransferase
MDYYEIYFTCTSQADTAVINDLLAAELGETGFDSFTQNEEGLFAYIPVDRYRAEEVEKRLQDFPLDGVQFHYTQTRIEGKDWNEEWEKNYFQPIRIDNQCLLRASFHPAETGFDYEIIINPKMAFGTGNHETTYLMLCEILALNLHDCEVLDMGCGTAVLAVLAAIKGAARVVAIDIDEWAYRNAIENCRLNDTGNVRVIRGDAGQIAQTGAFDYIFANINRNILLNDIRRYVPALKPGGALFLSGFYKEDIPVLEAECERNGLKVRSFTERNRWVTIKTEKI